MNKNRHTQLNKTTKTVRKIAAAGALAFGIGVGAFGIGNAADTAVTAYAQEYNADSTAYHLNLDADGAWRVYNADNQAVKDYDGLVGNEVGWWKCNNGIVDFSFNGLAENEAGWWKIVGGQVQFEDTGLVYDETVGWWYVNNGQVDYTSNSVVGNEFGWWKVTNGRVDFEYNGLAFNEFGWWKITNGGVDFGFTGVEKNEFGTWYVENGGIRFDYSCGIKRKYIESGWANVGNGIERRIENGGWGNVGNTIIYDGVEYRVENGKAIRQGKRYVIWHDADGNILREMERLEDGVSSRKYDAIDEITVDVDDNGNMIDDYHYNEIHSPHMVDINGETALRIGDANGPGTVEYNTGNMFGLLSNLNLKDFGKEVHLYWLNL